MCLKKFQQTFFRLPLRRCFLCQHSKAWSSLPIFIRPFRPICTYLGPYSVLGNGRALRLHPRMKTWIPKSLPFHWIHLSRLVSYACPQQRARQSAKSTACIDSSGCKDLIQSRSGIIFLNWAAIFLLVRCQDLTFQTECHVSILTPKHIPSLNFSNGENSIPFKMISTVLQLAQAQIFEFYRAISWNLLLAMPWARIVFALFGNLETDRWS